MLANTSTQVNRNSSINSHTAWKTPGKKIDRGKETSE